MKYVFRFLKKNALSKSRRINGCVYYEIPIVTKDANKEEHTYHVYINKAKTYEVNGATYMVLDDGELFESNYIKETPGKKISDKRLLKILSNDYISYMVSSDYSQRSSHAMNNFMPIGIQEVNPENNATRLNKWHEMCDKIHSIYGSELTCIEPFTCDELYPFHYNKFKEGKFTREYRANVMMFILSMDSNFIFTSDKKFDNQNYIYYKLKDRYYPFFRMLTDEQFYESCLVKDVKNHKTTPFLKRFSEQGMARELIHFIKEDEEYKEKVVKRYKEIRDEMKLNEKSKVRIFIPALGIEAIDILKKMSTGKKVTKKEFDIYQTACQERIGTLAEIYYDRDAKFFFSYDDLNEEELIINGATKRFVDMPIDTVRYDSDTRTLYAKFEKLDKEFPLYELITKNELDTLKENVYKKWLSTKYYKR